MLGVSGARVLPAGGSYSAPVKKGAGSGKREEGSGATLPSSASREIQSPIRPEAANRVSASPVSRNVVQSSLGFAPICL